MTLRCLKNDLGPPFLKDASFPSQPDPQSATLAFAFDSSYLEPFKVMAASIVASGSFLDAPVAIYTDDATVLSDPIVQRCADRTVLLAGHKKEILYRLAEKNVKRTSRHHWNRGTFLKWMIFEEHSTDALLFLDVDMICLENLHDLLVCCENRDFVCANQFKPSLRFDANGERLDPAKQSENLHASLTGNVPPDMRTRVNSGMMLVRKSMLNDGFFKEITSFASRHRFQNEQIHFTKYFEENPDVIGFVGTEWNFQENEMGDLSCSDQFGILQKIKILHYASTPKPWKRKLDRSNRPSTLQWHRYRTFANNIFRTEI